MRPCVYVLLSTYNGKRFLREQLQSLIAQDYENWILLARDDGSSDGTPEILEDFAAVDPRIRPIRGQNVGVTGSFLELLATAPEDDNVLYAFCDQDDVWLPDKLSRAVTMLDAAANTRDSLYFAAVNYVSHDLRLIATSKPPRFLDFGNAAIENVAIGCTILMGNGIRRRLLAAAPESMLMHDWWAYLTASAFGEVLFDPGPCMLYRQHGSNVSMWESSVISRIRNRLIEFVERWRQTGAGFRSLDQAARFIETYKNDVPDRNRQLIVALLQLRCRESKLMDRVHFAFSGKVHRNRRLDDWAAKALIIARRH